MLLPIEFFFYGDLSDIVLGFVGRCRGNNGLYAWQMAEGDELYIDKSMRASKRCECYQWRRANAVPLQNVIVEIKKKKSRVDQIWKIFKIEDKKGKEGCDVTVER